MTDIRVAVGHTVRPWRSELQRHARDFVTGVQIQVYRDGRALQAAHFDALLLDGSSSLLDASLMAHCADHQIPVAAVYDPRDDVDGSERARVEALGVAMVHPSTLDDLLVTFSRRGPAGTDPAAAAIADPAAPQAPTWLGQVIAVGGPGGSGTTEVAVGLAAAAAASGRTILVDIDELRPSVARRLGLTLSPHIINAIDEVSHHWRTNDQGTLDALVASVLARPAVANPHGLPFDVIAGLPSASEWASVPPDRLADLLTVLRRIYATILLRLGPSLEDLSRWIDRFGASRLGAREADRIVSVADGSPTGVAESLDWLAELREVTDTSVDLVVNRVPPGKFRRAELAEVLEQAAGGSVASVNSVRFDKTLSDRSWFGELATKGVATKDISAVASRLLDQRPTPPATPSADDTAARTEADSDVIDVRDGEPVGDMTVETG